jgi:hypothetical protein
MPKIKFDENQWAEIVFDISVFLPLSSRWKKVFTDLFLFLSQISFSENKGVIMCFLVEARNLQSPDVEIILQQKTNFDVRFLHYSGHRVTLFGFSWSIITHGFNFENYLVNEMIKFDNSLHNMMVPLFD